MRPNPINRAEALRQAAPVCGGCTCRTLIGRDARQQSLELATAILYQSHMDAGLLQRFRQRNTVSVMLQPKSHSPEAVLEGYFRAKDGNRPHLLEAVFAHDAELLIRNQSTSIAFPAVTHGRPAIAEVLVRSFALSYENIYSFYLERPAIDVQEFTCAWLVGMSERLSGHVRIGCGTYVWEFEPRAPHLASRLTINIEAMQVLPSREFEPVFAWLGALNHPWSSAASALQGIPRVELLAPIAAFLGRNGTFASPSTAKS